MKINKGLNAIYLMQAIDGLAFSISGIFIPVLMFSYGYSFRDIIFYFIFHNIVLLVATFVIAYAASFVGLKKTLLLRYPFLFFYLFFLIYLPELNLHIFWLALASGIQAACYYTSLNILFARHTSSSEMGTSLARLSAIPQTIGLAGPMIGAVVSELFGFKALFAATFVMSLFSLLPLLFAPSLRSHYDFRPMRGFNFFRKHPKLILSEIFDNIGGETEGVIWPIFVFLTLRDIISVGIVGTLAGVGSIIFTLLVGKLADQKGERPLMRIAVPFIMATWLLRFYLPTGWVVYITTLLSGFFITLLILPYTRLTFNKAKKETNEDFYIVKEVPTVIGRLILFSIALILIDNIKLIFPIAGLSYLYFLFL